MYNIVDIHDFNSPNFINLTDEESEKVNGGGPLLVAFVCGVIVCFIWETGNVISLHYSGKDLGYWSGELIKSAWNWFYSQF